MLERNMEPLANILVFAQTNMLRPRSMKASGFRLRRFQAAQCSWTSLISQMSKASNTEYFAPTRTAPVLPDIETHNLHEIGT